MVEEPKEEPKEELQEEDTEKTLGKTTDQQATNTKDTPPPPPAPKPPSTPPPPQNNCDPNYSGCVPIASDVDCAGGSGNGPAYVVGPVTVIGYDIYRLDSDGDGIGCE